jgi:hypothetical protein
MYIRIKYNALLALNSATIMISATASGQNLQSRGLIINSRELEHTPAIENKTIPAVTLGILSINMYSGM